MLISGRQPCFALPRRFLRFGSRPSAPSPQPGAAYRTRWLLEGLIISSDLRIPNDSDAKVHFGAELWPHEVFALRGGFKTGYDEESGSFGFGVKYDQYVLDYAFVPFSAESELGNAHRISVDWRPALR